MMPRQDRVEIPTTAWVIPELSTTAHRVTTLIPIYDAAERDDPAGVVRVWGMTALGFATMYNVYPKWTDKVSDHLGTFGEAASFSAYLRILAMWMMAPLSTWERDEKMSIMDRYPIAGEPHMTHTLRRYFTEVGPLLVPRVAPHGGDASRDVEWIMPRGFTHELMVQLEKRRQGPTHLVVGQETFAAWFCRAWRGYVADRFPGLVRP